LLQIGTSVHKAKARNDEVRGVRRSKSEEAEVRFEGLVEASFSTPWVE